MEDLNLSQLDKDAREGKLTEENVEEILKTMREISSKSKDVKILNEIKETSLAPGSEGTVGEMKKTNVSVDPVTGSRVLVSGAVEDITEEELNSTLSDKFKNLLDNTEDENTILDDKFEIKAEDIPAVTNTIFNIPEEAQEENELSESDTLKIMEIIERVQKGEKFNIYNEFPPIIQKMVDNTLHLKGFGDHSINSNTARNKTCLDIVASYIKLIKDDKYKRSFIKQFEDIQKNDALKLSDLYSNYEKNKQEFLKTLLDTLEEDDPRRETLSHKLDIMEDAYSLNSIIEYASTHRIKVKHIDYEKPQRRIFDDIESKYRYNPNYDIIAIHNALSILSRHNKKTESENLKFFAAFSKACMNMNIEESDNHLLIYSILRNIVFLDVYKGEEYEKFSGPFLENIDKVLILVK